MSSRVAIIEVDGEVEHLSPGVEGARLTVMEAVKDARSVSGGSGHVGVPSELGHGLNVQVQKIRLGGVPC